MEERRQKHARTADTYISVVRTPSTIAVLRAPRTTTESRRNYLGVVFALAISAYKIPKRDTVLDRVALGGF
jgi:hypothetical protein